MQWLRNLNTAVSIIKLLVALAATSGGAMTLALLNEMRWYAALTIGAVFTAAIIMTIVGVDYLYRTYTINRKISAHQLSVVNIGVDPMTGLRGIQLFLGIKNDAERAIYFKVERIHCQLNQQTHARFPGMPKPIQIQAGKGGGSPIPPILNLPSNIQQYEGYVEVEVKYGKNEEKVPRTYRTRAEFSVFLQPVPNGGLVAAVQVTGGTGEYE
jgi:hypothetical protein